MSFVWETVDIPTHRLQNARWVSVWAYIRKNATGEVRKYVTNEIIADGDDTPRFFNWEDGNQSCDCNREINFERVNGKDIYDESQCSDGKFSVNLVCPATGEVYYREFE